MGNPPRVRVRVYPGYKIFDLRETPYPCPGYGFSWVGVRLLSFLPTGYPCHSLPIGAHKILSYIRVIQMNNSCCFVGGGCKPRLGLASATAAIHLDDPDVQWWPKRMDSSYIACNFPHIQYLALD